MLPCLLRLLQQLAEPARGLFERREARTRAAPVVLRLGAVPAEVRWFRQYDVGRVGEPITNGFGGLRSLELCAREFDLEGLDLPRLTVLRIQTAHMTADRLRSLLTAKLPQLERLELWFGPERTASTNVSDLSPLFRGALGRLTAV